MTGDAIPARVFTQADQLAFAHLSGDHNPIHVDEQAARRTQAGAPVVHGVHAALWALEQLAAMGHPIEGATSIRVQFPKFLYLDIDVQLRLARSSEKAIKVQLVSGGVITTILDVKFGPQLAGRASALANVPDAETVDQPRRLSFSAITKGEGWLSCGNDVDVAARFPELSRSLGAERVRGMVLLSNLVGMICPGLHSVFSGYAIDILGDGDHPNGLHWRTSRADDRFHLITMDIQGLGIAGQVQAFMRAEPVEAPSVSALQGTVDAYEFSTRTALVVGGSRGLGAVTAKLLAAGGARVIITYVVGRSDAEALVKDIQAAYGADAAAAIRFDVLDEINAQFDCLPRTITHLYYFATPRIAHQSVQTYSSRRFDVLAAVYVNGFEKFVSWAMGHLLERPRSIFYPSSVFIEARPKGMVEYAMAKVAGEVLAAELASATRVPILTPRIPRVLTDQTATMVPFQSDDPVAVMLPLLRAEP